MQILHAYNLPVAKVKMGKFIDRKVLIVERFDRVWVEDSAKLLRVPQEDICYESDGGQNN